MTLGRITAIKSKGLDFPTEITVEYVVDGISYFVTETLKLKSEVVKIGFIPIGRRKFPAMGDASVGSYASVNYNPLNPAKSYLTYNIGRANV